jgi:hypothetical protein
MFIVQCPNCSDYIIIEEINCQIFRHAEYKDKTRGQLPPHSSEAICNDVFEKGLVYGCAKPFRFDGINVTVCDYI